MTADPAGSGTQAWTCVSVEWAESSRDGWRGASPRSDMRKTLMYLLTSRCLIPNETGVLVGDVGVSARAEDKFG
jgi:hypothetical protein